MRVCQNIPTWFWASFFQNLNTFGFSWHIFWSVSRVVTILLLMQRSRLGGPFRYLEHVRKIHRKCSRGFWKKSLSSKHEEKTKLKMRLEYSDKSSFLSSNFFQRSLQTFLWTLWTCSEYLKGPPNLDLYISKIIVTARHIGQIICQEKWKK